MFDELKTMDMTAVNYSQMFQRYEDLVVKLDNDPNLTEQQRLVVMVGVLLGTVGALMNKLAAAEGASNEG